MNQYQLNQIQKQIDCENDSMIETNQGFELNWIYKGYPLHVTRIRHYGYLCGYIEVDVIEDSEVFDIINQHFHGGVTYHRDGKIGFDCFHIGLGDFSLTHDYNVKKLDEDMYEFINNKKDNHYVTLSEVKTCLTTTVDALIESSKNQWK